MIHLKKHSIWTCYIEKNKYPKLQEDIEVDVLIIGGGITGISTAYHLLDTNLNICLIERNQIASGISSRTTGKLTYLQNLIYSNITNYYSKDVAKKYYDSQKETIELVENIVHYNQIDCDYKRQKSYLFASLKEDVTKIKKEKELLEEFGENITEIKKLPVDIHSNYGISVSNTAYFNPVKYLNQLANICQNRGVKIYEDTRVLKLIKENNKYICLTDNSKIIAKKVIIATHYPFFLKPFFFPAKCHIERSYLSASLINHNKNVSGINTSNNSISFRYYKDNEKDYFLYLKGMHNIAFKYNEKEEYKVLCNNLKKLNVIPIYLWTNEDIITNDYLPYIGQIAENLYIGTGYNTWGMTNGSLAGKILADLVTNKDNKYVTLFNPKRKMPLKNIINVTYDLFSSIKPFIENNIVKNKKFYHKKVLFTKLNGEDIAIFIDDNNVKHIVYSRCPHMKCPLIFNEVELTWDCPCHASRFDIDGFSISGPSKYNIAYEKKDN